MHEPIYERIYAVVRQIPPGQIGTYGQVASIVGECTARMVGYAMAALPHDSDVPWQRVINAQGKISPRGDPLSSEVQRLRLEEEGVHFLPDHTVDGSAVRWQGPTIEWRLANGFAPVPTYTESRPPKTRRPSLFDE